MKRCPAQLPLSAMLFSYTPEGRVAVEQEALLLAAAAGADLDGAAGGTEGAQANGRQQLLPKALKIMRGWKWGAGEEGGGQLMGREQEWQGWGVRKAQEDPYPMADISCCPRP